MEILDLSKSTIVVFTVVILVKAYVERDDSWQMTLLNEADQCHSVRFRSDFIYQIQDPDFFFIEPILIFFIILMQNFVNRLKLF